MLPYNDGNNHIGECTRHDFYFREGENLKELSCSCGEKNPKAFLEQYESLNRPKGLIEIDKELAYEKANYSAESIQKCDKCGKSLNGEDYYNQHGLCIECYYDNLNNDPFESVYYCCSNCGKQLGSITYFQFGGICHECELKQ